MNSSPDLAPSSIKDTTDSYAVLAREAGVPFKPPAGTTDPFDEWLSLMEVVQMLCPVWPERSRPVQGKHWRL